MHSTPEMRDKAMLSVKKSQGTITKVLTMIEQDEYCPDTIQQIDSAIGLLKAAKKSLLTGHLDHCLEDKLKQDKQKTVEELVRIFNLN
jgi:DNA-binding FrmR family transcriptional regulator